MSVSSSLFKIRTLLSHYYKELQPKRQCSKCPSIFTHAQKRLRVRQNPAQNHKQSPPKNAFKTSFRRVCSLLCTSARRFPLCTGACSISARPGGASSKCTRCPAARLKDFSEPALRSFHQAPRSLRQGAGSARRAAPRGRWRCAAPVPRKARRRAPRSSCSRRLAAMTQTPMRRRF